MAQARIFRLFGGGSLLLVVGVALSHAAGLVSCGSNGTPGVENAPPDGSPPPDSGNQADIAAFLGNWDVSGTTNTSCNAQPEMSRQLENERWIARAGSASPLEIQINDGCPVAFDVATGVATARPGQSCKAGGDAGSSTLVVKSLVMTPNADGASISLEGDADITIGTTVLDCATRGEYAAKRAP